jgi:tetratricopeptide (TPR) repeat protein
MKRSTDKELMDLPGKSVNLFIDDLRHLRQFNRYLGGSRSVIKGLERLIDARNLARLSILDVGTGSADIPRAIVRWARGKAVDVEIVAMELDAIAAHEALIQTQDYSEITVIRGDGANAPFHAGRFDVVIASQLLHHFSESDIVAMLGTWSGLAREAILISDLLRHRVAYHGIGLVLKQKGDFAGAAEAFHKAETMKQAQMQAQAAGWIASSGTKLLHDGKAAAAIEKFRFALTLNPKLAVAHYRLALALLATNETEALAEFEKASQLDPRLKPPRQSASTVPKRQ